jgi:hypothetical protein
MKIGDSGYQIVPVILVADADSAGVDIYDDYADFRKDYPDRDYETAFQIVDENGNIPRRAQNYYDTLDDAFSDFQTRGLEEDNEAVIYGPTHDAEDVEDEMEY